METEVKLSFKDKEHLYGVTKADFFRKLCIDASEPEAVLLENTYIVTPDMNISRRSGAIRVRHYCGNNVDKYEFTVKYGGGSVGGLHKRMEWNVASNDSNFSIDRFIREAEGGEDPSEMLKEAFGSIKDEDLIVLCSNSFNRTVYTLSYENSKIEACFDSGLIKSSDGSRTDEICELELELIEGDVASLNSLSKMIMEQTGCVPLDDTKYRRTLAMTLNGEARK